MFRGGCKVSLCLLQLVNKVFNIYKKRDMRQSYEIEQLRNSFKVSQSKAIMMKMKLSSLNLVFKLLYFIGSLYEITKTFITKGGYRSFYRLQSFGFLC